MRKLVVLLAVLLALGATTALAATSSSALVDCRLPDCNPNQLFDETGLYEYTYNECAYSGLRALTVRANGQTIYFDHFSILVQPGQEIEIDPADPGSVTRDGVMVHNAVFHLWGEPVIIELAPELVGNLTELTITLSAWDFMPPELECPRQSLFLPVVTR